MVFYLTKRANCLEVIPSLFDTLNAHILTETGIQEPMLAEEDSHWLPSALEWSTVCHDDKNEAVFAVATATEAT